MEFKALSRFSPGAERGKFVDRNIRLNLQRSLRTLYSRLGKGIIYDDTHLNLLLKHIGQGPVRAAVFGTYTDLAESLFGEDFDAAQQISNQLLSLQAPCPVTQIITLSKEDLGPHQPERYARLIDDDPEQRLYIQPVRDKAAAISAVAEARSLLSVSAPELAGEIDALVHEIVMVEAAPAPDTGEPSAFEGASTLYLWGAVIAKLGGQTRVELAQTLAHESGHLLLFGLTHGQPLVDNDFDERYESPLRADARPMEGLVHAAYVLARMHYALNRMLSSGCLLPEEREEGRDQLASHERAFRHTLSTIERHGRFTEAGAVIFREAINYMGVEGSIELTIVA